MVTSISKQSSDFALSVLPELDKFVVIAAFAFFLWFGWVGHIGSDDKVHLYGALGWLNRFPYIPENHGEVRHLITLPAAFSMKVFGMNEYSAVAPNVLYYLGLVGLTFGFVKARCGRIGGYLACLFVLTMPVFTIQASMVFADTTELFFAGSSIFSYLRSRFSDRPKLWLALSGITLGFSWLTRETTLAVAFAFALFYLIEQRERRANYFWLALGFASVLVLEALAMWVTTGDPLFRYVLSLSETQRMAQTSAPTSQGLFDTLGNIRVNSVLDPFLVLLLNHGFGLFWWVATFTMFMAWRYRNALSESDRWMIVRLATISILWFAVGMALLKEWRHPRYFAGSTFAMAIAVSLVLARLWESEVAIKAKMLALGIVGAGSICIYIDNRDPMFGEHTLLRIVPSLNETVFTDKETAGRLKLLLHFSGLEGRVSSAAPGLGALYFENPNRSPLLKSLRAPNCYTVLTAAAAPTTPHGKILNFIWPRIPLPPDLYRRLVQPNFGVQLVRISQGDATCL